MKSISRTFRKVHGVITFYDPVQKSETTTEVDFYDKTDKDIDKIIKAMPGIVVDFEKITDTEETRYMTVEDFIENSTDNKENLK